MKEPAGRKSPRYGDLLGHWRLQGRAGRGSFGTVFKAHLDSDPTTLAALKVARAPGDRRFLREAHLLATARSPHLPRLLDQGEWRSPEGLSYPYIVMQWVEGVPLYAVRHARPLTNALAARLIGHVARALAELHRHGGVHRDVKGDNVLVSSDAVAVLVDLGAGWHPEASPLTDTSVPPGTEVYRSPELLRFRRRFRRDPEARYPSHPADDLYALGVLGYRLVTGTYPAPLTDADTSSAEPPTFLPPSDLATVAPELEKLILRMLSEEREKRGTAAELAEALEQVARSAGDEPIKQSPAAMETQKTSRPGPRWRHKVPVWFPWAGGAALGGLVVLLGVHLSRVPKPRPWIAEPWEVPTAPPVFTPDAGVADGAMASAHAFPVAQMGVRVIAREMPEEPLPGQRKPPCNELETEVRGGCWVLVGKKKPPCGDRGFEYEDGCYIPSFNAPRQPTSHEP